MLSLRGAVAGASVTYYVMFTKGRKPPRGCARDWPSCTRRCTGAAWRAATVQNVGVFTPRTGTDGGPTAIPSKTWRAPRQLARRPIGGARRKRDDQGRDGLPALFSHTFWTVSGPDDVRQRAKQIEEDWQGWITSHPDRTMAGREPISEPSGPQPAPVAADSLATPPSTPAPTCAAVI
jgi:hypothetical protein